MSFLIAAAAVSAGVGVAKAIKGGSDKRKAKKANDAAKEQMDADKEKYMQLDTSNPYLNMENTMEDLTVNTQAADFAAEQSQASTANVLNNMNQAAGGSGIAALAQAMANQGQIGAQKASISIAEQEKSNQDAERKEASSIQGLERQGEIQSRNMKKSLASTALGLSSADVQQTGSDIATADAQMMQGISDVGGAVGTFAGGIG
tara:strand:+ start:6542 stop:7153 length:612 start_codon:yes stop_codon:yes gene_type:complete